MKFLLALLLFLTLYILFNIASVVWKVRKGIRQFKDAVKEQSEREASAQRRRTTQTTDGVTIIDDRDPKEANKKIFAQDEGEYVDFIEDSTPTPPREGVQ